MDERERHLEVLKTTPERLKASLAGVPKKLLRWAPAPGKWSIHEIVCHMRDMEREAYLERYKRILAEVNPDLKDVDAESRAILGNYPALALSKVLSDWRRLRKECLKVLKTVKGDTWDRKGTHETAGELTLSALLGRHAVGNDEAHLGQIEAIKSRHELLSQLRSAPAALAEAGRGLSREALRKRPDPSKWAMVEIACHLRDIERVNAQRLPKMAFGERPILFLLDNDRASEALAYSEADWPAAVREFKELRADTLVLLRALPHAMWKKTGLHPKRGEITIEELAQVLRDHDLRHIERVMEIRKTL